MLEVELQGKLYLSSVLSFADDTVARIWLCEVRVIEEVQEVRAELQSLRLPKEEVFLQAQIDIDIARSNHRALSGTVSEGPGRRI